LPPGSVHLEGLVRTQRVEGGSAQRVGRRQSRKQSRKRRR
jgi:hypothetical protein